MSENETEKLHTLLQEFSTAMLVTHAGEDKLRARPMAIAEVEPSGHVWFLTAMETAKVHEIENDTRVHLVCQKGESCCLSISGRARLVADRAKIAEVWKEPYKVWFPKGKEDPNIVLIAVEPDEAEYWDTQGWNKAKYLWNAARAYVTGVPPQDDDREQHARVALS